MWLPSNSLRAGYLFYCISWEEKKKKKKKKKKKERKKGWNIPVKKQQHKQHQNILRRLPFSLIINTS